MNRLYTAALAAVLPLVCVARADAQSLAWLVFLPEDENYVGGIAASPTGDVLVTAQLSNSFVYFADWKSHALSPSGAILSTVPLGTTLSSDRPRVDIDSAGGEYLLTPKLVSPNLVIANVLRTSSMLGPVWTSPEDLNGVIDLDADDAGNAYVLGSLIDPNFNAIPVASKHDASGLKWEIPFTNFIYPNSIAATDDGAVVAASAYGALPDSQFALFKINGVGGIDWAQVYGDAGVDDSPLEVDVDAAGNIYLLHSAFINLSPIPVMITALTKLSPTGTPLWSRALAPESGAGSLQPEQLSVSDNGVAYVGGGKAPDILSASTTLAVQKFDADGNFAWEYEFDPSLLAISPAPLTSFSPSIDDMAVDNNGNVYVGGYGFDTSALQHTFVAKIGEIPEPSTLVASLVAVIFFVRRRVQAIDSC